MYIFSLKRNEFLLTCRNLTDQLAISRISHIEDERHQSKFVTDSRFAPGRSHVPPDSVARHIIAGTMLPQCRRRAGVSSPFRIGKHKPAPNRQSELHGDFRGARREPIRLAMRASFSESVGCQGLKRMAESIVPFARTTPSKGQLAIVASAKKKYMNRAKLTSGVESNREINSARFISFSYIWFFSFAESK